MAKIYALIAVVAVFVLALFISKNYLVESCISLPVVSKNATQTGEIKKLVSFVDSAAVEVEKNGEKSFADFRQKGSKWWKGDSYIFVYDLDGKTLVLPPSPEIEGTNRLTTKDSNGVEYVGEMIKQLKTQDISWVQYSYPKPGEKEASPKLSYSKKVKLGDKFIFVGSGVYY